MNDAILKNIDERLAQSWRMSSYIETDDLKTQSKEILSPSDKWKMLIAALEKSNAKP